MLYKFTVRLFFSFDLLNVHTYELFYRKLLL